METRALGRSGLSVAPLAFGGNVFGWTVDEPTSFALLDRFVGAGFNLIDTADVYSRWVPGHTGGESETIIGKWLKRRGKRDQIVIATKVGMELAPEKKGLAADYIERAVDESLRRLQIDRIDLYQAHTDDPNTPLAETLEAFDRLVKKGKVRAIGASNYTAARLRAALAVSARLGLARYESLQPLYNLYDRALFEAELLAACTENEVGVINFYSLASGYLTGKYRSAADLSKSPRSVGAKKYLTERGTRILAALDEVAKQTGKTQAQIAIAWLVARPGITAAIASASSVAQLNDLIAAATLKLAPESVALLDTASTETSAI